MFNILYMNLDYKSKYLKYKKKYLILKLEGGGGIIKDNTVIGKASWMSSGTLCGKKRNGYQCNLPYKTTNNKAVILPYMYLDADPNKFPVRCLLKMYNFHPRYLLHIWKPYFILNVLSFYAASPSYANIFGFTKR